jgi:hypothetical protein
VAKKAQSVVSLLAQIAELKKALSDCMMYVDSSNATMQTKMQNWQATIGGKKFNPANCRIVTNKPE